MATKKTSIGIRMAFPSVIETERRQFRVVFSKWIQYCTTFGFGRPLYFSFSSITLGELVYRAANDNGARAEKTIKPHSITITFKAPGVQSHKGIAAAEAEYHAMSDAAAFAVRDAVSRRAATIKALAEELKAAEAADDFGRVEHIMFQLFDIAHDNAAEAAPANETAPAAAN